MSTQPANGDYAVPSERRRPRLLDLFCGAGGCTKGYQRAGFTVTGVDLKPQPNYCGDAFVQDDAIHFLETWLAAGSTRAEYDAIHASPPCQAYSVATLQHRSTHDYVDLLDPVRELLEQSGLPWVIENVPGAPLRNWVQLCGSGFGMRRIRRHRWFEANFPLWGVPCVHGQNDDILSVVGHSEGSGKSGPGYLMADKQEAMGIDWMNRTELSLAIPPAYTEHIGSQLLDHLAVAA